MGRNSPKLCLIADGGEGRRAEDGLMVNETGSEISPPVLKGTTHFYFILDDSFHQKSTIFVVCIDFVSRFLKLH